MWQFLGDIYIYIYIYRYIYIYFIYIDIDIYIYIYIYIYISSHAVLLTECIVRNAMRKSVASPHFTLLFVDMIEFLLEKWPGNVYSVSLQTCWRSEVQSMFVAEYMFVIKLPT